MERRLPSPPLPSLFPALRSKLWDRNLVTSKMNPRRLPSLAVPTPATPLDMDDTLAEILLRLPPRPSALPRASMVCKRWRALVSDPYFLRRFRAHHRTPPLLGFFCQNHSKVQITPALDRIPAARFSLRLDDAKHCCIHSCRDGRVLFMNWRKLNFLVWEPITGRQRRVPLPPAFDRKRRDVLTSAILCAAGNQQGHVHGACHSSPFRVIFLGCTRRQIFAYVYSSETGAWSNAVSACRRRHYQFAVSSSPSVLVGNSFCWLLYGKMGAILLFDLDRQALDAMELPPDAFDYNAFCCAECSYLIMPADGGGLCFLALSGFSAQLWKREVSSESVSGWVLAKTIDLNHLLSLRSHVNKGTPWIIAFDEDNETIFVHTDLGVFMVHLESMQFKKLPKRLSYHHHHSFTSFYSTV